MNPVLTKQLVLWTLVLSASIGQAGQSGNGQGETIGIGFTSEQSHCPEAPCVAPDPMKAWREKFDAAEPLDITKFSGKNLFVASNATTEPNGRFNDALVYFDFTAMVPLAGAFAIDTGVRPELSHFDIVKIVRMAGPITTEFDGILKMNRVFIYPETQYGAIVRAELRKYHDFIIFQWSGCDKDTGLYIPTLYGAVNIKTDRKDLNANRKL